MVLMSSLTPPSYCHMQLLSVLAFIVVCQYLSVLSCLVCLWAMLPEIKAID